MAYDKITGEWIDETNPDAQFLGSRPFGSNPSNIPLDYSGDGNPYPPPSFEPPLVEQPSGLGIAPPPRPPQDVTWQPDNLWKGDKTIDAQGRTTGGFVPMPETPISISGVGNRMMIQDSSIPNMPAVDEYGNPVAPEIIKKIQSNLGDAPISEEDRAIFGMKPPSETDLDISDKLAKYKESLLQNEFKGANLADLNVQKSIQGALLHARQSMDAEAVAQRKTKGDLPPIPQNLVLNEKGVAPDVLKGLPAEHAATIKAIAEYRFPINNMRNPNMLKLLERAAVYDPTFDAKEYKKRQDLLKSYTSGPAAENLKSMNTLVGHLKNLDESSKGLDNGDARFWNWIRNATTEELTGDPRYTKFQTDVDAVATELAKTFKGGAASATDQETEAWRRNISSSKSPQALRAFVEEASKLMESRFLTQYDAYVSGMGKAPDMQLLKPRTIETLKELGLGQKMLEVSGVGNQSNVEQPQQVPTKNQKGGVLQIDARGNKAYVYPDGTFEEVR